MGFRKMLQYIFAVVLFGITIWALKWQFDTTDFADFSMVIWMPAGGILLYMATHFLNRTKSIRFYALQVVGVVILQLIAGFVVLNHDHLMSLFAIVLSMSLISLFGYLNVYMAFLVKDRSPAWWYFVAPFGLCISCVYYDGYEFLWILTPISLVNLLLLRRKP